MAPSISSISPTSGQAGPTLSIHGSGLGSSPSSTKVNIGTKTVTPAAVSDSLVTLPIPSGCTGAVNVNVTVSGVNSNSKTFFYIAAPTCTSVSPSEGLALGNGPVDVFGTGFATAQSVSFGSVGSVTLVPADILSDSHLSVTPPDHTGAFADCTDSVDVLITSPGGTSAPIGPSGQFTYNEAPAVSGVNPNAGTAGTATPGVIVSGSCFQTGSTVTLTSGLTVVSATNVSVTNDSTLTCDVPALAAGTYDVQVTTPFGGPSAVVPADHFVVS